MEYRKLVHSNVQAIGDYLGWTQSEITGDVERKRECPNCATYEHAMLPVTADGQIVRMTSAQCREMCWKCPGCTHGTACSEYHDGLFEKKFVRRDSSLRRFVEAPDLAARLGIHVNTVYRWVNKGKLNHSNGLVPGTPYQPTIIDSENCPLLTTSRRRLVSA
jgi:hypothetical protein